MTEDNVLIRLDKVYKTYTASRVPVPALHGVDFVLRKGEMTAVLGASGSGKTTLINILSLLDTYDSGEYFLLGNDIGTLSNAQKTRIRNTSLGVLLQNFFLIEEYTVLTNVMVPLLYSKNKGSKDSYLDKISTLLDTLELLEKKDCFARDLSGSQRLRVAIARATINDPEIILADEPTGELDSVSASDAIAVLKELNSQGKTMVIATDSHKIAAHCSNVLILEDGRIKS